MHSFDAPNNNNGWSGNLSKDTNGIFEQQNCSKENDLGKVAVKIPDIRMDYSGHQQILVEDVFSALLGWAPAGLMAYLSMRHHWVLDYASLMYILVIAIGSTNLLLSLAGEKLPFAQYSVMGFPSRTMARTPR